MTQNIWMKAALETAYQAFNIDEVPVGAVIVYNEAIIARAYNNVYTQCDPTGHAELLVLRQAAAYLRSPYLQHCDLYVTLEPCMMCAGAIALSRIRRLYFGAYDPKGGAVVHGPCCFNQPVCHHQPQIISGIMEQQCALLLQAYFKAKR